LGEVQTGIAQKGTNGEEKWIGLESYGDNPKLNWF